MPFVKTRHLTFFVAQKGDGAPVLAINGTGGDLRVTPNVMNSPLARHFHLTCYDQRGLGQTDKPDSGYTMQAYADDAATLMDALGYDSLPIIGLSFGGMVAQELALRHPERVEKMALLCTSPGGDGLASYPLHELEALSDEEYLRSYIKLSDTRLDDAWIDANPDILETVRARMDRSAYAGEAGHTRGRHGQLQARRTHDCWDRLGQIKCPVWLGGGKYDGIALPRAMQNLADRLPNATLEFFEGGHLFMVQDKRAYESLIAFLKETNQ